MDQDVTCTFVHALFLSPLPYYGTAQLQSNVHMRPRRVLHTFQMCIVRILDASHVGQEGAWHSLM